MIDLNLSQNLVWKDTEKDHLFFDPLSKPVKVKGINTGWRTLYREEPEGVYPISVVGPNYMVVPNLKLHNIISKFDDFDLSLNSSLSGNSKNKKFNLVYDVKTNEDFGSDSSDGGKLKPKLVVKNSYDGSSQIEILFGLFRMICSNMVVIPYSDKVMRFKTRHFRSNNNLTRQIYSFIREALNKEAFREIRRVIVMSKQRTDIKRVPYNYFANMPYRQLFPIIAGIYKFSAVKVLVEDEEKFYNLQDISQVKAMISRILSERTDPKTIKKIDGSHRIDEAMALRYMENVNNHWQLYNLVLKIAQNVVVKERRISVSRDLSRRFLYGGNNG